MLQNKIGRAFLVLVSLLGLAALIIAGLNYGWWSRRTQMIAPAKFYLALPLTRGPFKIKIYSPGKHFDPRALIIFGSGDGGWRQIWEGRVASFLSSKGYAVGGIDFKAYSATDYSSEILGKDTELIASALRERLDASDAPLVIAGFSMGAAQAVPAAAYVLAHHPLRKDKLAGLLLCALGERGRYGLRTEDTLDVTPTGPNTFGVTEFNQALGHLRVAQFQGGGDVLSSTAWLDRLAAPHRLWELPNGFHSFSGASDAFLGQLADGLDWVLAGSGK